VDQETAVAAALNDWSLYVQITITLVMAVVFFAIWRNSRREPVLTWGFSWVLDSLALLAVLCVAKRPEWLGQRLELAFYLSYAALKTGFAVLLLMGLEQFLRKRRAMGKDIRKRVGGILLALFTLVYLLHPPVLLVQTLVYLIVMIMMYGATLSSLYSRRSSGIRLLSLAFFLHGSLFLHHALVLAAFFFGETIPVYMSHLSFLDAGLELFLGLALVLSIGNAAIEEMARTNARLEAAQRWLRELVDADPLTGLFNRRRLRSFVRELESSAAILVYLDVDLFKDINDRWGHQTGDASLLRVAEGLRKVFRSGDGLFRMGGDEFLVVAPGLARDEALRRIEDLRKILAVQREGQPAIQISAGVAVFDEECPLDRALTEADHAMYRDKEKRHR